MGRTFQALVAAALLACTGLAGAGERLQVAASHALQPALAGLAPLFERRTGHSLVVTYGNSSAFTSGNSTAFDVLLLAGADEVQLAQVNGLATGTPRLFALGRLAAITSADFPAADWQQWVRSQHLQAVAMVDPSLSAHGRESAGALTALGVIERLRPKIRTVYNAPAALALLREGKVELAIVPMALAREPIPGTNVGELPEDSYRLLPHHVVLTPQAARRAPAASAALAAFLFEPDGRDILRRHGYRLP